MSAPRPGPCTLVFFIFPRQHTLRFLFAWKKTAPPLQSLHLFPLLSLPISIEVRTDEFGEGGWLYFFFSLLQHSSWKNETVGWCCGCCLRCCCRFGQRFLFNARAVLNNESVILVPLQIFFVTRHRSTYLFNRETDNESCKKKTKIAIFRRFTS